MFTLCYYADIIFPLKVYFTAINFKCYYADIMLSFKEY